MNFSARQLSSPLDEPTSVSTLHNSTQWHIAVTGSFTRYQIASTKQSALWICFWLVVFERLRTRREIKDRFIYCVYFCCLRVSTSKSFTVYLNAPWKKQSLRCGGPLVHVVGPVPSVETTQLFEPNLEHACQPSFSFSSGSGFSNRCTVCSTASSCGRRCLDFIIIELVCIDAHCSFAFFLFYGALLHKKRNTNEIRCVS